MDEDANTGFDLVRDIAAEGDMILCMGAAGRLGLPTSGYMFGTYENAANSGDGYAMAYHAGAALANLAAVRARRRRTHFLVERHAEHLEWVPPRDYGVRSIPQIDSASPLWKNPALPQEVEAGHHWLPGTVFGGRETLVTTPVRGEIRASDASLAVFDVHTMEKVRALAPDILILDIGLPGISGMEVARRLSGMCS